MLHSTNCKLLIISSSTKQTSSTEKDNLPFLRPDWAACIHTNVKATLKTFTIWHLLK